MEVLQLFNRWFDIWPNLNLLECEALVNKAAIYKLIAHLPHVLFCHMMHIRILLCQISKLLGTQAQFLRHSTEETFAIFLLHMARWIDARDKSDPDLVVLQGLDKTNILVICTALFDSDPLQGSNIIILSLIVLVYGCHLLRWKQNKLAEHEMQIGASLLNVSLFKSLYKDVALS